VAEFQGKATATTVSECVFSNNKSPSPGGAIEVDGVGGHLRVLNSTFSGNEALFGGALAVLNGATVEMRGATLKNNKASFGGALATIDGPKVASMSIDLSHFKENVASVSGGAITAGKAAKWSINGSIFELNRSGGSGGAISGNGAADWSLESCGFVGNEAAETGGAIFSKDGKWTLTANVFTDNEAGTKGGAIAATGGKWTARDIIAKGNQTKASDGGGLWCQGGAWFMEQAYFAGNKAVGVGGAMYIGSSFDSDQLVVAGNQAASGGGVYLVGGGPHVLHNWLFEGNVASKSGGGLHVAAENAKAAVTSATFMSNQAGTGGGIAVLVGSLKLEHSIVWGNKATGTGAQIHIPSSNQNGPVTVATCDVQTGAGDVVDPGKDINGGAGLIGQKGSFTQDPLFVAGPAGNAYLSQKAAGQPKDSPCVDSSTQSITAAQAKLDKLTTRTDGKPDKGQLDLGYHNTP
jgi:predicted outer membrane repeat protein